jgi:hypothetical protein
MSNEPKNQEAAFRPERAGTGFGKIPLSSIVINPPDYAFRGPDALEIPDGFLEALADSIRMHGVYSPVMLARLPNGGRPSVNARRPRARNRSNE